MTVTDQIAFWTTPLNYQTVTVSQIKKALVHFALMQTISDAISAEVTNVVNIQWDSGLTFSVNDPLYSFIKSTLSYTDTQMASLMQYAVSQTP